MENNKKSIGKKEKKLYISIMVFSLLAIGIGIAYAYWLIPKTQNERNLVNTKCFELDIDEGTPITITQARPMYDTDGQHTDPYHFVITNTCTSTFDYQINLESLEDTTLLPDYVKVSLNQETPFLLSSKESVSKYFDTSTDSRKLLVGSLEPGASVSYDLRLWIDGISTVEQSANKEFYSKVVVMNTIGTQNMKYKDSVVASAPMVYEGLVPIKYQNNKMIIADEESAIGWYNYENHEWANAVLVKYNDATVYSKYFDTHNNLKAGVEVDIEDVLQMYVWIPRYKYKLWNAQNGTSEPQVIEIEFVSTDTKNDSTKLESEYQNGEWLVHPAFTFGNTELPGIWVGKFEMTGTVNAPTILPNEKSMTITTAGTTLNVSTMFNTSQNIAKTNSSRYGVASEEIDTHMMKNSEWGAVAYLSHSIYGRYEVVNDVTQCIASGCQVWINNVNTGYGGDSSTYSGQPQWGPSITGCAGTGDSVGVLNNQTACPNGYDWLQLGVKASTTGNVTGIYDMSGGAWEYVMGNMYDSDGTTPRYQSSGFNASNMPDSKYYDTYAYQASDGTTGTTAADSLARYHLGEGTRETLRTIAVNTSAGWYNDYNYVIFSSAPWVDRGGSYYGGSNAGLFYFGTPSGGATTYNSFRSVLSGK